ncbi:hypothetical protein [Flavobacterium sp.]|uniref:hypothetical protein n=1 Tax=Flavobacterium sp. TaxID=239 RepID=UPI00286E8EBA|nr:hypothetical protein [Flavobacterium sp.]
MVQDFIPRSEGELAIWLGNYGTNSAIQGPAVGLTPAQIAAGVTSCNNIVTALSNVENKRTALNEALAHKETVKNTELQAIRSTAAKIKTNSGYTDAIGKSLGIIGTDTAMDLAAYKPLIFAEQFGGFVRIKFTKKGVEGINIYHRKKGEPLWKFLARDTKSPYDDHIALGLEGQPEHWEYRAFGVMDDAEIGQPSDIVAIVYGG